MSGPDATCLQPNIEFWDLVRADFIPLFTFGLQASCPNLQHLWPAGLLPKPGQALGGEAHHQLVLCISRMFSNTNVDTLVNTDT